MPALAGFVSAVGRAVQDLQARRVIWRSGPRVHIRVRGVEHARGSGLARAVEAALQDHPAVSWAAVNAPLGTVVVECAGDVPAADLIRVIERVEAGHPPQADGPRHPVPMNRVPGTVVPLAAAAAGMALAGAGRALRTPRLPAELASLVQFADTQPRLRSTVERAAGPARADVVLAAASALAQSAAQGLGGLAVDVGYRALQLAEAVMQKDAWARAEPALFRSRSDAAAQPAAPERPRPLPPGPVEDYAAKAGAGALAAGGGVLVTSRRPRRAAGVAVAAIPKAARLGQEAYGATLGCLLARRGLLVIDHRALRTLDRIDTVVIDSDVLPPGTPAVAEIVPVGGADLHGVTGVVQALFDPDRIRESVSDGRFTLAPLAAAQTDDVTTRAAAQLTGHGASCVLALAEGGRPVAVVAVVRERSEAVGMLLAAARRSGADVVLAAAPGAAVPGFDATRVVPTGRHLVASIRGLQADGAVVLLVSGQRRALAAADVGVGLTPGHGPPAWGAHILAGPGPAAAAIVLDGARVARAVAGRSVRLAQAGSALGAALALGRAPGAPGRGLLAVNGAAAVAVAAAAWSVSELARLPASAPATQPPWHAIPADAVLARLRSRDSGLTDAEAQLRWRPDDRQPPQASLARAFVSELANPLTPILGGGAALSASIGAVADAVVVSGVCALSALFGSVQRVYTERSMAGLLTRSALTARVLRGGTERVIPATGLVSGDVVLLGAGDVVAADCRLLASHALQVDESSLTGESVPAEKAVPPVVAPTVADRRSMLYEGTSVVVGRARAVVVATGAETEAGRSMSAASAAAPVTGVEHRLSQITRTTLPLAVGSAVAVVAAGLLRGHQASDTIGAAVGLAVASVPEGLPFLVTAAQLASARRLARHGALVRNPRTIEALGRVNVLCFDKTGTLTQGRMALAAVADGTAVRRADALAGRQREVLAAALRATPATRGGRRIEHVTDQAVIDGAVAQRLTRSKGYSGWQRVDSVPFEPSRGYHATLGASRHRQLLSVKGAPEVILPRCTTWRGRSLGPRDRRRINAQLTRLAKGGYRVLAVAENEVPPGYRLSAELTDMTFAGFIAFGDPVRTAAGVSVRELREAGVHVVMITGDHPVTAAAIATELDVLNGGSVLTGPDIDRLDEPALATALTGVTVIARCTPEHKVRVVRAFQADGRVVAMTGDGANDAAAIRLADVGIALGRRGTPAARAAGDLVVTDDRLETIISAVTEGRAMWRSVRQAIGILVGGNVGEIGYTLFGTLVAGTSPLSARQLLLVNLLTDLVPAMAVALRTPPPETAEDLLAEGPDLSLGTALTEEIAVRALATGTAAGSAWVAARMTGSPARARTVGLAAVVGAELGQTLLVGGRSPAVALATVASLGILVAVVQTPGVSQFFGCTPLGPAGWSIAALSATGATFGSALVPRFGHAVGPAVRSLAGSAPGGRARAQQAEPKVPTATRSGWQQ